MSLSTTLRVLPPTARSMSWAPLSAATAALAVITAALQPWNGHTLSLSMIRVAVGLAAAAGVFALDDRAAATVAASPTTLARRRAARLVLVLAALSTVVASACLSIAVLGGTGQLSPGRVVLESSGMVLAAVAYAVALGGDRGACVFLGTLLAALVVQQRFPEYALFPIEPGGPGWDRAGIAWLIITSASAAVIVLLSRDPVSRFRHRRSAG